MELIAPDLYRFPVPFRAIGIDLGLSMTVARLAGGGLFVHSPVPLDDAIRRDLDGLGEVRFAVAPSKMHYFFAGAFKEAYPDARLYGAPGLGKKAPRVPLDGELGGDLPADWPVEIVPRLYAGSRWMNEVVFLHAPSRSLLLTDLAFNVRGPRSWWTRQYLSWSNAYDRLGQSKLVKLSTRDRVAGRRSVDEILELDFDRLVLAHGEPADEDGKERFRELFTWL